MSTIHGYLRMKALQDQEEVSKQNDYRGRSNKTLMVQTSTRHDTIPDMTDDYSKVVNSGHKPSPEEINYRRFTSGSWVDSK
jgi:hypothetical protein